MVRDAKGLRDLQEYLASIKDFDDAAFADATGGADRAELMELLDRLTGMLAELDELTTQIRTGPDRMQR